MAESVRESWHGILNRDITDDTDFFKCGAGSMDVVRLVEEVRQKLSITLKNEDVYMSATFAEFVQKMVRVFRGLEEKEELEVDYAIAEAHGMTLKMPHQLFVNNQFFDSSDGVEYDTINPADESVICKVSKATVEDVDDAVEAAKEAFYNRPWSTMNPRDKGRLMYRYFAGWCDKIQGKTIPINHAHPNRNLTYTKR